MANRTRIVLILQRNVPAKYVEDREGLDRLIELSVGKFVRKDNIYIEGSGVNFKCRNDSGPVPCART